MTWDSVPWFVGGGAQHSPEVARLLAFAATSGAEGIVTPGDLKVVPLANPGGSIRVLTGAALILNHAAGGAQQTYVGRNPTEDVVAISPTGSGSGRSDLVIARVEDSNMAGEPWQTPTDRTVGPYIFTRIIPNVSPTTTTAPTGTSGIVLARIDIPANTSTITSSMIKDLRKLARPRTWNEYDLQPGNGNGSGGASYMTTAMTAWTTWPTNTMTVDIPKWATWAQVGITLSNLAVDGPCDVNTRINLGGLTGSISYFDYNGNVGTAAGFVETRTHNTFAEFDVTALQGMSVALHLDARRTFETLNKGNVWNDASTQITFDIRFSERVV